MEPTLHTTRHGGGTDCSLVATSFKVATTFHSANVVDRALRWWRANYHTVSTDSSYAWWMATGPEFLRAS